MKIIIPILLSMFLVGCFGKNPEKTGLKGKILPSFNLLLPDSSTFFNTNNIPYGKSIVLLYFSPNCAYSRAQIEEIIEDINLLNNIQFYIFTSSSFSSMKGFYQHYQLNKYPNIVTGLDYTNFFVNYFKVQGVPYLAIYGKNKRLNEAFLGKIYGKQIKEVTEE